MARHRVDPQLQAWPESIEQMQGDVAALEDLQLALTRETAKLARSKLATMNGEGLLDRPGHRPGQHRAVRRAGRYGPRTTGNANS